MLGSYETLSWSLLWCQRKMVASMESKQTYYILHISYTNSEISNGLSYIRPYFVRWFQVHHCATLVRDLPTSILVLAPISLLTFHKSIILILRISSKANFRSFSIHDPRCLADSSCMVKAVQQHKDYQQQFQKKKCVSIKN